MLKHPEAFPLCDSHPTLIVFTGKTWCHNCMLIQGELDQLQQNEGQDYHFLQLDDADPNARLLIPKFGEIRGVPTFLLFDPASSNFIMYDGERKAETILNCLRTRQCTGRPHKITTTIQLVDHSLLVSSGFNQDPRENMSQASEPQPIDVCRRHPSFIVFTSKQCHACQEKAPIVEELQKQYGAHMQHFDADDNSKQFEALGLEYVPTALHFDPQSQIMRKIPLSMISQPDQYQQQPVWNVPASMIRMQSQCPASTMGAECPMMMSGECPLMMGGECPAMTVSTLDPNMAFQIFDSSVMNPRALPSTTSPESIAATITQRLQNAMCDNMVVDVCRECYTFFVFTGTNWCTECQMFVPELIKLKQHAKCGRYHVNHYDAQVGIDDFNRRICRIFEIEKFPTVLVFDPKTFTFAPYQALLRFKDLKHAPDMLQKVQTHQRQPTPREISFRVTSPDNAEVPVVRMRLCADCPSVLIFALHLDKYEHALKQNGKGLHVLSFSPSDLEARQVFEAFKINTVPKVLIYNPHMGNFYVFDGASKDVPSNAAAALKHVKGRIWHDTPTIVVYRS